MKTIFSYFLMLIGLVAAHASIYHFSEKIALHYAIPYQEITDEEAIKRFLSSSGGSLTDYWGKQQTPKSIIDREQAINYQRYGLTYVEPIQNKINTAANILFSIGYIILIFLVARVLLRWMQANGGRVIFGSLKSLGKVSIELLGNLGLKKLFLNHRLKLAQTEFLRLKSLFDNGLITEGEFLAKKVEIERKIRNENLLNK